MTQYRAVLYIESDTPPVARDIHCKIEELDIGVLTVDIETVCVKVDSSD